MQRRGFLATLAAIALAPHRLVRGEQCRRFLPSEVTVSFMGHTWAPVGADKLARLFRSYPVGPPGRKVTVRFKGNGKV